MVNMSIFLKFVLLYISVTFIMFSNLLATGYSAQVDRAEREVSPKEAYRLSKDVVHDMFIEPGKYAPVFRELLRSDDLYEEMCHELERDTQMMTERQFYRWDQCRKYFSDFYGLDLNELRN